MIRFLDILLSLIGLIIVFPIFIMVSILIILSSRGGIFFRQERIGKKGKIFQLLKFRTMYTGSNKESPITIGSMDSRITRIGRYLRKLKIDELPQLYNVLIGEMSMVGPRPELQEYVNLYDEQQKKVLSVRPGITDYASIEFVNENDILSNSDDPEKIYIEEIMPEKIRMNMKYIDNPSVSEYFSILIITLRRIYLYKPK